MSTHKALQVRGVRLVGVTSAVPGPVVTADDDARVFGQAEMDKIRKNTGVERRHVVPPGMCTSDLCLAAARRLIRELEWDSQSIDLLIFVSQTPDYFLPATACILHGRMELGIHCAAFDVNLGCSGYTYGLWMAATILSASGGVQRRALVLAGDTCTQLVGRDDRSAAPLFGDGGSATALEYDSESSPMHAVLGTDGTGFNHLIAANGSFRDSASAAMSERVADPDSHRLPRPRLCMDAKEVFLFTIERVPELIRATMEAAGWNPIDVDAVVMHQANRFILQHLARSMKLSEQQAPISISEFGNTSSASIPLTLTHSLRGRLEDVARTRLLLVGFGVGLSWAALALEVSGLRMPPLIVLDRADLAT